MNDDVPGSASDRLSGWKEIAAHLGKSVRSAQRWEAELDLPIDRLVGPEGGQIVQASRRELDAWRQSRLRSALEGDPAEDQFGVAVDGLDDDDTAADELQPMEDIPPAPVPVIADVAVAAPARGRKIGVLALVLAAGVAVGALGTLAAIRVAGAPSRFEVHGTRIQALTEDGYPVWTHALPRIGARPITGYGVGGRQGDLDGDGELEAAVPITFANPWMTTAEESDEVRIFSRSGALRATIRPTATLMQYGRPYSGPWLFADMAFSSSGPGRLWISYNGVTGRPSVVLEVDGQGASKVRFVTEGAVAAVTQWATGDTERLLIGGADATTNRAMVAAIDLGATPTSWPDAPAATVCASCQWQSPAAVALLPPTELMGLLARPNAFVWRMRIAAGQVIAEGELGVHRGAMYWFDPDLAVSAQRWLPQYRAAHRDLETQGKIDHPFERCPDATKAMTVDWWRRNSGWTTKQVLPLPDSIADGTAALERPTAPPPGS